jgi:hypothetical protein
MTTEERHAHWRTILKDQTASGKDIATYCRELQIHTSLFYTWRRKLREKESCARGFVELASHRSTRNDSGVGLRLGGRLFIEVERGFDPSTLLTVIETLSGSRCSG